MQSIQNGALYLDNILIIDVRSPSEYHAYHIEGAINMPLFTDDERAEIGTAYKKESTSAAKKIGLKHIAYKIEEMGQSIIDYSETYDKIIIYCQRGGMRSGSLVSLMNTLDLMNVYQLEGGIKGHRQYIDSELKDLIASKTFVTLHGLTGVGKTKILRALDEKHLVLNYEEMAQNAGSVFGNILFRGPAPSQKQFEEMCFYKLKKNPSTHVFIESESKRVGSILIPDPYMQALEDGHHILIETSIENRIENLMDDYACETYDPLKEAILKLKKRLSNEVVEEYLGYIDKGQLDLLVENLLLHYYDPLYNYSIEKYTYDQSIFYKHINDAIEKVDRLYTERILNA